MDPILLWILGSSVAMGAISLVGAGLLLLPERRLEGALSPVVALAAGAMLGGAWFHMLPEAVDRMGAGMGVWIWTAAGFVSFFVLEQFLHWHHCHLPPSKHRQPVTYLVLFGDSVHNFIDGLAVAGAFVVDVRVGIMVWLAAAAHEVPQELGDFGVLLHGGWSKGRALAFNFLSALTYLAGGLVAYAVSTEVDVSFLLALAAGNFLYIGAADLVPEINKHRRTRDDVVHFAAFTAGLALLLGIKLAFKS